MKQVAVVSGKGGTGKTILVAALAALAENQVLADCDVDAPDLHLLLHPEFRERHDFTGIRVARIDPKLCDRGKRCAPACRFAAIRFPEGGDFYIEANSCEGCEVCVRFCHTRAISMEERKSGEWYISKTKYGPMVHALLKPGEENSGRLVTVVRNQARLIAERENLDLILIDGPPGIGCPVISAVTGVDEVLAVTEPTRSGRHDLVRILDLAQHFGIHSGVVINKFDLNLENSKEIEDLCLERGVKVWGRIPFDPQVVEALVQARPVVEGNADGEAARAIQGIWQALRSWSGII